MTKLKQALSGALNNANRRDPIPPGILASQTTQRVDDNTPRGKVGSDRAGGSRSGLNNENDQFKNELLRFMRKVSACMDQILGAPPVLKGPDSKKYTQLPYKPSVVPELIPKRFKMPEVPKYDGTSDPHEHITTYTMTKERMLLPAVLDEWAAEAFTKGLNPRSLDASRKLKESLLNFQAKLGQMSTTGDCRHLRKEVATLLKNGQLREFLSDRAKNNYGRNRDNTEPSKEGEEPPRQTINMIFGGNEINGVTFLATKKTKVSITHSKRLWEDDITFTEEDVDRLLLPHNDALVISLNMLDFKIKTVLVDPRSSANIVQWRVLEQAKLTGSIILTTKLLAEFNLASVTTRGEILLLMNAEGVMKTTLFEVVDGDMGYNIILGRPWLHEMKVIPSTYHKLLKFSMPEGIKQIRGDQPAAREMNAISVSNSKGKEHTT
ncbi:uncharacterized protein [Nicotiana tomentosiformis]|uniref:uncharacterized protein n=1 Tax=Nicotiana tomentosiformis TaxID=4098 RepID=UPI00388CE4CA